MVIPPKTFECVIQGEVSSANYPLLIQRMDGLVDDGTITEDFAYKEFVYSFDRQCRTYVDGMPTHELRARQVLQGTSLFTGKEVRENPNASRWEMHYIGKWERKPSDRMNTIVRHRNHVTSSVNNQIRNYYEGMGFRHVFRFMRGGKRWQLPNGIIVESSKLKALGNDDSKDVYGVPDLINLRVDSMLLEVRLLADAGTIDEASSVLRRFVVDLEPYFIERPDEAKDRNISTATLAAEARKKRPRP